MNQFFRDLTKNRTETSRAVILSHIALPDTLKKGIQEQAWQRRKSLVHGHRVPSLLSSYVALKYKNQVKNRFQLRYRSSYYHATFTAASFISLCLVLTCHIRLFKNNSNFSDLLFYEVQLQLSLLRLLSYLILFSHYGLLSSSWSSHKK